MKLNAKLKKELREIYTRDKRISKKEAKLKGFNSIDEYYNELNEQYKEDQKNILEHIDKLEEDSYREKKQKRKEQKLKEQNNEDKTEYYLHIQVEMELTNKKGGKFKKTEFIDVNVIW